MNMLARYSMKRRKYLIDSFQYRLLTVFILYFVVVLFVLVGALFFPLIVEINDPRVPVHQQYRAAEQFLTLHFRLWPPVALTFVLLVLHSVVVSHRIAGPLYRMRCVLRMIGAGCLTTKAKFRKHDYLVKERETVNGMIDGLRERIGGIKKECASANVVMNEMKQAIVKSPSEDMHQRLAKLDLHLSGLTARLALFQLPGEDSSGGAAAPGALLAGEEAGAPACCSGCDAPSPGS